MPSNGLPMQNLGHPFLITQVIAYTNTKPRDLSSNANCVGDGLMTKIKQNNELYKQIMEKTVCAFCLKKGCRNKCRTEYDTKILNIQIQGYEYEDLEYVLRKTRDALEDVFEMLNEKMKDNTTMERLLKKKLRKKPSKKTAKR